MLRDGVKCRLPSDGKPLSVIPGAGPGRRGATYVEYAICIMFFAGLALAALSLLGSRTNSLLQNTATRVGGIDGSSDDSGGGIGASGGASSGGSSGSSGSSGSGSSGSGHGSSGGGHGSSRGSSGSSGGGHGSSGGSSGSSGGGHGS